MLENMLSENGINFNALEKEIYKIGCEIASEMMKQILTNMDQQLKEGRDKKTYRHKGSHATTLKTLMGEVTYSRTVYETRGSNGEKSHVYLLDKELGLSTFGKVTSNLAARIAECVSVCSYRETAEKISSMTGQTISHGGAWNVTQALGEKLSESEERNAMLSRDNQGKGEVITPILFEEADGVWINMQGKDRPKKKRKRELKMAAAYDGWEQMGKGRYVLRNKILISGFEDVNSFRKKKEGAIASVFNVDEITMRILNGDGGAWIKSTIVDGDTHYQLDPFHKNREITRKVKDEKQREVIRRLLSEKRIDDMLLYIKTISELVEEEAEKKKLKELYGYFLNNKEGLLPYQERGLAIPAPPQGVTYRNLGTMEHHVCDGAAKRMKHQKASWSKAGAENMARLLCRKACGNLYDAVTSLSGEVLPEHYREPIEEVLSSAKAPQKDGKGYQYPNKGRNPFAETFVTNGRKAILGMLGDRYATELVYR